MSTSRTRRVAMALLLGFNMLLASGCAVTGRGYVRSPDVRFGVGYYERGFGNYGGWGPSYRIGPYRNGVLRRGIGRVRPGPRGFRPAPRVRPIPSIPSRPHPRGPGGPRGPHGGQRR